jgi:hypothetical protein
MRLAVVFALISLSVAGLIRPKTTTPIVLSYNNKDYSSDYTFKF